VCACGIVSVSCVTCKWIAYGFAHKVCLFLIGGGCILLSHMVSNAN
jgi:hypothetical protein